jgi:RimJ/RimL family protein N-acetyltransferase
MKLRFERIEEADVERLAAWMPTETWPYHGRTRVDAVWVRRRVAEGDFYGPDAVSFWIVAPDSATLGIVRAFDLPDVTPLVDLRISAASRGRGVGTAALDWVTRFVFESRPETVRLGGYTRHDNVAMRRVFDKCRFVQEAYHRQSWPVEGADLADSVGYSVLRCDWTAGTTTPLPWP